LSGRIKLPADRRLDFVEFVKQEVQLRDGKFYIAKVSGVFEANGWAQAHSR
jgi:hypothetical protein